MIRTRLTEMFGLAHPLMGAPMAMHSGGNLAGAVTSAGALGAFGGLHLEHGPEWVTAQAGLVRERTDGPFAIGFITAFLRGFEGHFQAALDAGPAAIALSFGDPAPWVTRIKDAGCRLICQVQTFADAEAAVAAGADVLVAQGNEAGGHTGTMTLLPFLAAVAQRYPEVPLLAAGGIGDGRTLAAALLMGADGAWVGTALLATPEATEVDDAYKAAIVQSDGADTVFTSAYDVAAGAPWPSGIAERVRRDAFTDEWEGREAELRANPSEAKPAEDAILYGMSAGLVGAVRPAADVIADMSAQAERILRDRPAQLLG